MENLQTLTFGRLPGKAQQKIIEMLCIRAAGNENEGPALYQIVGELGQGRVRMDPVLFCKLGAVAVSTGEMPIRRADALLDLLLA